MGIINLILGGGAKAPKPPEPPKMDMNANDFLAKEPEPEMEIDTTVKEPKEPDAKEPEPERDPYPIFKKKKAACPASGAGCPSGCPENACQLIENGVCKDKDWPLGCPLQGCPFRGCVAGETKEYSLLPCDVDEQRIGNARLGKWCDNPKYPNHTICVRRVPKDFCRWVKRPVPLPKNWQEVPYDAYHNLFVNNQTRKASWQRPKVWSAAAINPEDSLGDLCCGVNNCADIVDRRQPWCITPDAFDRYRNSGNPLEVNCGATLAKKEAMCWWTNDLNTHPTETTVPPASAYEANQMITETPEDSYAQWIEQR